MGRKMLERTYDNLTHQIWKVSHALSFYLQDTYTGRALAKFGDLLAQLWYFVVLGALLSTLVWRFLPKRRLQRALAGRSSILLASLLGLVSPMCTFAALPMVGTLIAAGMPAAPLIAFAVASPLMNPTLFTYTAGTIGLEMAWARLITACCMGLFAGYATRLALGRRFISLEDIVVERLPTGLYPIVSGGADQGWRYEVGTLARRFVGDLAFIGKFFALGLAVASLASVLLSEEMVLMVLGPGSAWAVPAAVALGVPLYACGGGSIPIVETMIQMGMTTGAALAFFIAGPATKFATLGVLAAVFGRRMLSLYLVVMLAGALFWGYLYPFERPALQVLEGGAPYSELVSQ